MSIKNMQEYADLRYKGDSTIPQRLRLLFFQLDELHKQQAEINQHIDFLEKTPLKEQISTDRFHGMQTVIRKIQDYSTSLTQM